MSKPKTEEELLRLLDAMHEYCMTGNWDSETEQAYQEIKEVLKEHKRYKEEKVQLKRIIAGLKTEEDELCKLKETSSPKLPLIPLLKTREDDFISRERFNCIIYKFNFCRCQNFRG